MKPVARRSKGRVWATRPRTSRGPGRSGLDPGPIALSSIERFDDPDIEGQLEHDGADPATAQFRLVAVGLADPEDVSWFPGPKAWGTRFR
jgi:hypothetical protein